MELNKAGQYLLLRIVRCKYDFTDEYTAFNAEKPLPNFDDLSVEERSVYIALVSDLQKQLTMFKRCLTKLNASESILEDHNKLAAAFQWRHESLRRFK